MKNLKISKKLMLTFGITLILFFITIIISIFGLRYSGNQFEDFYKYSYPMSTTTLETRRSLQAAIKSLGLSMLTEDEQVTNSYVAEVDREVSSLKANLASLQQSYRGDTSRLKEALDMVEQAGEIRKEIQSLAAANRNTEAADLFFDSYSPIMLKVQDLVIAMDENTTALADSTYETARQLQTTVTVVLIVVIVLAVIVTVLMAAYLTRSLTRPISEIETAATRMAEGHLDVSVNYQSKDELGSLSENMRIMTGRISTYMQQINAGLAQLADGDLVVSKQEEFLGDFHPVQLAVRKLVDSLNSTLTQINRSSDQVAAGSEQVSTGAMSLSQGATEQASSVEELAATITEISEQVSGTAENAAEARNQTGEASKEVDLCNRQMQEMIEAMGDISHRSTEIGKIIKAIEDIAFQTNILALNAAVEAARAGEAGKGFAVVADEVRNLANKSQDASKGTATLIEGTVNAVSHGTKLVSETAQSLQKVVDSTKSISGIVDKIASAANRQAASIGQVTQGIDQISNVVQNNSATAEESAAASEELSAQAEALKELVAQFKLQEGGAAQAASRLNGRPQEAAVLQSAGFQRAEGGEKY